MKDRIKALVSEIGKTMQNQLASQQFDLVATTSMILARARGLQKQIAKDEQELVEIEDILKHLSSAVNGDVVVPPKATVDISKTGRAEPQTIRIKIDWRANRRTRDNEEIYSPIAAEVMTEFVARLVEEFGKEALNTLAQQVRANRAPLLSRSPETDFGGYQRKQIRGTDWFLLTNNSTLEKIELLEKIWRVLGLMPGSVEIKREGRFSKN
jgi:hypothetical protein